MRKLISLLQKLYSPFLPVDKVIKRYFDGYGGYRAMLSSPYFLFSIILSALMYGTWIKAGWWNDPIGILPSLIGFTLGGYAILTAFGDQKFKELISGKYKLEDGTYSSSPFLSVSFAFVHFIMMQILALTFALIAKSQPLSILFRAISHTPLPCEALIQGFLWFVSYTVFIYALMCSIAATLALFRITDWYDEFITAEKEKDLKSNQDGT